MSMFIEFPPVSTEEWEAAARADLMGKSPGKVLYRAEDRARGDVPQPWPARAWQIWAPVANIDAAQRALKRGAEGLVVAAPTAEWLAVLQGVHLHTSTSEASLTPWATGLSGTIEAIVVPETLPGFRAVEVLADELTITQQVALCRKFQPNSLALKPTPMDLLVPVGPLYFEEIAKFRALRRMCPGARIIARTSRFHATAYEPHVNLLRATTEAMAAIIGGCDALIVTPFTEACGYVDEHAERLALNTQLLLRDEAYFAQVADPAAGSWYIEALTLELLRGTREVPATGAFVGVNKYPNATESAPAAITTGRATTALEQCRHRADKSARRPTVRLVRGTDEKISRARAAFSRDFFVAGGFAVVNGDDADITVLCDADANYPAARTFPVLAAGLDFGRHSDHPALIAEWQNRLGI